MDGIGLMSLGTSLARPVIARAQIEIAKVRSLYSRKYNRR